MAAEKTGETYKIQILEKQLQFTEKLKCERFPQLGIVYDDKLTLYKPKGCSAFHAVR